jgi:hypothetical protein
MIATVAISLVAVIVSATALFATTLLSLRQQKIARQASHIPTFLSLMSEFRHAEFHARFDYIASHLRDEHPTSLGVFGLPDPARMAVLDIAFFLQTAVMFVAYDLLDKDKVIAFLHSRLVVTWAAIEPYVEVERDRNPVVGRFWLSRLEYYALEAKSLSDRAAMERAYKR